MIVNLQKSKMNIQLVVTDSLHDNFSIMFPNLVGWKMYVWTLIYYKETVHNITSSSLYSTRRPASTVRTARHQGQVPVMEINVA